MVTPVRTVHDLHPRTPSGTAAPAPLIHFDFVVMSDREARRRARWRATERAGELIALAGLGISRLARAQADRRPGAA